MCYSASESIVLLLSFFRYFNNASLISKKYFINIIRTLLFKTLDRETYICNQSGIYCRPSAGAWGGVSAWGRSQHSTWQKLCYHFQNFAVSWHHTSPGQRLCREVTCSIWTTSPGTSTQFVVQIAQFQLQVSLAGSPALLHGILGNTVVTNRSSRSFAAGL